MRETLLIGWDVGGWRGKKDGLAALSFSEDGALEPAGRPCTVRLGDMVARSELTLQAIAERLELVAALASATRVMLAIDAPLGYPRAFAEAAMSRIDAVPPLNVPLAEGWIRNPLAYRETDRYVFEKTRKRLLSPSLDALANNTSKARAACACLKRTDPQVRILPFDSDDAAVAVIEVYPALWKADRNHPGIELMRRYRVTDADQKDACLCALTAACYEEHRLGRNRGLPAVMTPPPHLLDAVQHEGWIFAPVLEA